MAVTLLAVATALGAGCAGTSSEADSGTAEGEPTALQRPIVDELKRGMENGSGSFDHSTLDALLSEHVDASEGTVDYAGLADDSSRLDDYLSNVAEADLTRLSRDAQLALLINAYNAYTVRLVTNHYPDLDSIREIDKPWSSENYRVGGHELSLDQIEHRLIRPLYRDPRIHFAVNCAAVSCPRLAESAYTGDRIDRQLEDRTRATLSNEHFVRVEQGTLRYTRVMKWYRFDFVDDSFQKSAGSISEFIRPYASDAVGTFIDERGGDPPTKPLDYDWSLNDSN